MRLALYGNGPCFNSDAITTDGKFWMRHSWLMEWSRQNPKYPIEFLGVSKRRSGFERALYPNDLIVNHEHEVPRHQDGQKTDIQEYVDALTEIEPDALYVEMSASMSRPMSDHMVKWIVAASKHLRIPTIVLDGDMWSHAFPAWIRRAISEEVRDEYLRGDHPMTIIVSSAIMDEVRQHHVFHRWPSVKGLVYCYDPAWNQPFNHEAIEYDLCYLGKNYDRTEKLIRFYGGTDCRIFGWKPELQFHVDKNPECKAIGADRFDWFVNKEGTRYKNIYEDYQTAAACIGLNHRRQEQLSIISSRAAEVSAAGRLILFDADCVGHFDADVPGEHAVATSGGAVELARMARRDPSWLEARVHDQRRLLMKYKPELYVQRLRYLIDELESKR